MAVVFLSGDLIGVPTNATDQHSPHIPHAGPLGTFLQILLLLDHPKVIAGMAAAS